MLNKKIDIIIPTYNGAKHIVKLLESIRRQTFTDYDCYVIDDNSRDDTVRIIESQFSWIKLIKQNRNRGPSHNRNIAIEAGYSPYIAIFDDDVYLADEKWLSKGLEIIERNEKIGQLASMIVSGYDEDVLLDCGIHGQGPEFGGIYWKKHKTHVLNQHRISRRVLGACTAGTILRRDIFEKVGGFDPKYYYISEDLDLSIRIHLSGHDVIYAPSLVTHHYESQAMGKRAKLKHYLYHRNSLLIILEHYPFKHIAITFRSVFRIILSSLARFSDRKKTKNYFKSLFFLFFSLPQILSKRWETDKIRKKSREYLLEINHQLSKETSLHLPVKSVIYSITNQCNGKCKMCFLHESLNKKAPLLTLDEIRKMFLSFKMLNNIVLGGGEPFLRDDIDRICYFLIDNNDNPAITIPTNGSLPDTIYEKSKNILSYGCHNLLISLSIDGPEKYHNHNRGIPGLFQKVRQSYRNLLNLKAIYGDSMNIQVNTCVTPENIEHLDTLFEYICAQMPEAEWIFEPVRGSFDKKRVSPLSIDDWKSLYQKACLFNNSGSSTGNRLKMLYGYALNTLKRKSQIVPCAGGEEFISIDHTGNISPCEILFNQKINIRDINYDINRLRTNEFWEKTSGDIKQKKCFCTHFCWLSYSLFP